ncbi:S-methyl-5-thioribose-1-phosphate isomerase [Bermanella marisrubri]|uniref:Methylthioribose-1-phosphate isomerase n=1 Tax=Bermanella marisrubri TaxID=207949 RepID=Q1N0Y8_9GAMM|nr:S-methyl-5-thioribose-1-phosphate isomerase [Bermanella marisrubri]EAT11886.1 translation initiation factor IF-2B subunit alpha [Oceanobacter sp. RED65] [Bermanella marisrubri]QIZ83037.1 S-methyl-5-thioribose-1-phosphate isomerase [Bermanella marisrubri]
MLNENLHSDNAAIIWQDHKLLLLDQRILPQEIKYIECSDASAVANAIKNMVVRGAPAIGISAAYALALAARKLGPRGDYKSIINELSASRPTAINLFWAIERVSEEIEQSRQLSNDAFYDHVFDLAQRIHKEDILANQQMGRYGSDFIASKTNKPINVITHCNAGALATGGYGTALGVIRSLHEDRRLNQAYASETRPWLQGARLTAFELMQEQIKTTLVTEGAIGQLMAKEDIHWVIVGADRIAANGDVANKIGTYNLAVLAKHHGVSVMVVAPTSTFDMSLANGQAIPIEHRPISEITDFKNTAIAPNGCHAINPSFDVTPHEFIDAIVCEHGVIAPPNTQSMSQFLKHASDHDKI